MRAPSAAVAPWASCRSSTRPRAAWVIRAAPAGLLDAETNLTYAVKYLAGAYRTAGGNQDRAVSYYASGYYYAAKRQGLTGARESRAERRARRHAGRHAAQAPVSIWPFNIGQQ